MCGGGDCCGCDYGSGYGHCGCYWNPEHFSLSAETIPTAPRYSSTFAPTGFTLRSDCGTKGEGTPRKLATVTQPQRNRNFRELLSDCKQAVGFQISWGTLRKLS
jgi:hypothetical protein